MTNLREKQTECSRRATGVRARVSLSASLTQPATYIHTHPLPLALPLLHTHTQTHIRARGVTDEADGAAEDEEAVEDARVEVRLRLLRRKQACAGATARARTKGEKRAKMQAQERSRPNRAPLYDVRKVQTVRGACARAKAAWRVDGRTHAHALVQSWVEAELQQWERAQQRERASHCRVERRRGSRRVGARSRQRVTDEAAAATAAMGEVPWEVEGG
eukprot:6204850-Pleurochrysis_carterae.AAC.1